MKITEFQSQISRQGIARQDRWTIEINPPSGLSKIGASLINFKKGGLLNFTPELGDIDFEDVINADINIATPFGNLELGVGKTLERIELYATTCQLPARDMSNFEATMYGEARTFATKSVHSGVNATFYLSEDMRERRFFENWQNLIFDPVTKKNSYYNHYVGDIVIKKWDHGWNKITAIYKFKEAYPTNVGANELNHNHAFMELGVTFNYRHYERIL